MKRTVVRLAVVLAALLAIFVAADARRTLAVLDEVERERDTWQRPDAIIDALELRPGMTVADLGSGAGYFALKIAPLVEPGGQVLAVDLRRVSLAFLWLRALRRGHSNLHVIHGQVDDPHLPPAGVDAVLIANTYHELTLPHAVLAAVHAALRQGARLVVVDRGSADSTRPHVHTGARDVDADTAVREIEQHGFVLVSRHDRFIDTPGDEHLWWMTVYTKP